MIGKQGRPTPRLTYANIASTLALIIAIGGGSAYAASHLITGKQIASGTITAKNIKTHTLLKADFKSGQIPAGPRGPAGTPGTPGSPGAPGTAVAYGEVSLNGVSNPTFTVNKGFPGTVTEPQNNVFCVVPPSGYASVPLELTPFGETDSLFQQVSPQQCPGDYEIVASQTFTSGQGFTVVIP